MTGKSYFSPLPYDVNWLNNNEMLKYMKNNISYHSRHDLIHVDTIGLYPYSIATENRNIILNHHNIESAMSPDATKSQAVFLGENISGKNP